VTVWQLIDTLAIGWRPFGSDGGLSVDELTHRLRQLNEPPDESVTPKLRILVNGADVQAWYEVSPDAPGGPPGNLGLLQQARPIFRGQIHPQDGVTKLAGSFGVGSITRLLGVVSCVEVVAFMVGGLLHTSFAVLGPAGAVVPILFIVTALVTRANAGDDVDYLIKNLQYAIAGEP
jgi:hypothetical protein